MGLTNDVLTTIRVDTSQAQQAVKSLRGVERDRAKALLDDLNAQNAGLEASIAKWVKVGAVVGGVGLAWKGAQVLAHAALEDMRLESAAAGINVDRLKAATRGLVEEDKLLEFAGRTKAGMWKLNQEEMGKVLRGADAIAKVTGQELTPVIDALTESIAKGNTRALKEFGIEATDKQGVLRQLGEAYAQLGGDTARAGDEFRASGVHLADSMDNIKGKLGEMVVSLEPFIDALAATLDLINRGLAALSTPDIGKSDHEQLEFWAKTPGKLGEWAQRQLFNQGVAGGLNAALPRRPVDAGGSEALPSDFFSVEHMQAHRGLSDLFGAGISRVQDAWSDVAGKLQPKTGGRARYGSGINADPIAAALDIGTTTEAAGRDVAGALQRTFEEARASQWQTLGDGSMAGGDKRFREEMGGERQEWLEAQKYDALLAAQAEAEKRKKLFESVFGSPDEITAIATALGLAHTAVDGMTGAIAQSFEAWVTGAESASGVFKRVIGGVIHSLGVELAQVAAKHLILAAVDAVTLNPFGASMHLSAAAIAGAGAAGMFLVAKSMGYGAQAPTSGTGASARGGGAGLAAGGGGAGTRSGGSGDRTTIIYLAPDWSDETPTQRKQRLARAVREGAVARTSNVVLHR